MSMYDKSIMEPNATEVATNLKRHTVRMIETLKQSQKQLQVTVQQFGIDALESQLPTLRADYDAISKLINYFDGDWDQPLPAKAK